MDLTQAAYDYSVRIAEIVKHLRSDGKGFPLSDDLLKCGVDAGMLLREASDRDKAISCLNRADYLLEMAVTGGYLTALQTERIRVSGQKLMKAINETRTGEQPK